ncbi:MAG TPA: hypothetical protein VFP40_05095 [Terriglobales bacterium]|nr:hypothetical protein [Terriglobales bacterium]
MTLLYSFWFASWLASAALVAFIYKKKLHREYPIFASYLLACVLADVINYGAMRASYKFYYITYWATAAVTTLMGFAVLHEIFRHIFRPYESLRTFGSTMFRWSSLVLLMIGFVMALSAAPTTQNPITSFIFTIDRSVGLMQCGLVIFMYLFARHLGLAEGHRVFGISIGLGLTAAVHLVAITMRSRFQGNPSAYALNIMYMTACITSTVIWFVYMYRQEPERRRATVLEQTENWNYALSAVTNGNGDSAFLPSVVDTVEKVLTKRATSITSEFKLRG